MHQHDLGQASQKTRYNRRYNRTRFYYAIIDMRQADIFIVDGTVGTATTTTTAAALKDDTSVDVTSATGLTVGEGITIGGSVEFYVITAIAGSTIHFVPKLTRNVAIGESVDQMGNMLEIKTGEGTLTYSEKRGVTYVLNRGHVYATKLGDDVPVEVSMQFIWEFLRSRTGEPPTPEEAFKQIGNASTWVSSDVDPCAPYSVDIAICYVPPCGDAERITLNYFRWESLDHDLKAGSVDVKGSCNIPFATVVHGLS